MSSQLYILSSKSNKFDGHKTEVQVSKSHTPDVENIPQRVLIQCNLTFANDSDCQKAIWNHSLVTGYSYGCANAFILSVLSIGTRRGPLLTIQ